MTATIIDFMKYRKQKFYPVLIPDAERQELIENGYDPDDYEDVQAYWADVLEG